MSTEYLSEKQASEPSQTSDTQPKWYQLSVVKRSVTATLLAGFLVTIVYLGANALAIVILLIQVTAYYEMVSWSLEKLFKSKNGQKKKIFAEKFHKSGQEFVEFSSKFLAYLAFMALVIFNAEMYTQLVCSSQQAGWDQFCQFRSVTFFACNLTILICFIWLLSKSELGLLQTESQQKTNLLDASKRSISTTDLRTDRKRKLYHIEILFCFITIASIITIGFPGWFSFYNLQSGLIWLLGPMCLVFVNDTAAYFCGRYLPWKKRHPLIKLSPNKTWEGYLGAAVFTVGFAYLSVLIYQQFPEILGESYIFENYHLVPSENVENRVPWSCFHAFIIAGFISIFGPFGGFFASAIKRGYGIEDFGTYFPGHGGVIDRFDCVILTNTFIYFYLKSW